MCFSELVRLCQTTSHGSDKDALLFTVVTTRLHPVETPQRCDGKCQLEGCNSTFSILNNWPTESGGHEVASADELANNPPGGRDSLRGEEEPFRGLFDEDVWPPAPAFGGDETVAGEEVDLLTGVSVEASLMP